MIGGGRAIEGLLGAATRDGEDERSRTHAPNLGFAARGLATMAFDADRRVGVRGLPGGASGGTLRRAPGHPVVGSTSRRGFASTTPAAGGWGKIFGGSGVEGAMTSVAEASAVTAPFVAAIAEQAAPAAIAASEVADIASSVWSTTAGLMYFIEYFHLAHDMEWWAAIMATTAIMRVFVMPFMIMQQRVAARMHIAKPEIEALNARIKGLGGDQEAMGNAQKEVFEIWKKHNCNPAYMMLPIAVQAPLFISFYFAISEMAKGVPSFAAGGPDWPLGPISMTDLTAADPTYIMPLLSSATFLATVELGGAGNPETAGAAQQTMMTKWGLRGLAVALVPMTAGFSKGVFVYWITTNGWSLLQTLAFKVPVIKKIVAIPEVPKEATIGAKASVVTKRQIEEKFGEAPAVHASNPKVSAHFAYLAHVFWRPVRPVSPLRRRRRRDVYDEEQDSNEPFFDYI